LEGYVGVFAEVLAVSYSDQAFVVYYGLDTLCLAISDGGLDIGEAIVVA
jgi:hypothetical protein